LTLHSFPDKGKTILGKTIEKQTANSKKKKAKPFWEKL